MTAETTTAKPADHDQPAPTSHARLLAWVEEVAQLTQPDRVHWHMLAYRHYARRLLPAGPAHLRNPATSVVTWPLPLLTGILSVVWSLGLMGLLNVHLDPLNTTTPILVLAVASGHAIQILKRYYEEYARLIATGQTPHDANLNAVVESIVRVGPVMMVAGMRSAVFIRRRP